MTPLREAAYARCLAAPSPIEGTESLRPTGRRRRLEPRDETLLGMGSVATGHAGLARAGAAVAELRYCTFTTRGGVQVPSRIDGLFSFGQYMRSIGRNAPFGAGSQLFSLSLPGDSFWK